MTSIGLLAIGLNLSTGFTSAASAATFRASSSSSLLAKVDLNSVVMNTIGKMLMHEFMKSFSSNPSKSNTTSTSESPTLSQYIASKKVDFQSSRDGRNYSGKVASSWVQGGSDTSKIGVGAEINWNDGVKSSILFLKNRRVRIWNNGKEFGGQWGMSDNNILYVKTDEGSVYQFRS